MRKLTQEEFDQRIKSLVGDEYTFLEPYQGTDTKIECRHNKCNYHWSIKPSNFYHGYRCPKCSHARAGRAKKKNTDWYKKQVKELVGDEYTVLGKYEESSKKVKMRHNECGYEWGVTPNNFLRGRRCPECNRKKKRERLKIYHEKCKLTPDEVKERIRNIPDKSVRVIGEYNGSHNGIKTECKKCKGIWYPRFTDLIGGLTHCPFCNNESNGEQLVRKYLKDCHIKFKRQKTFNDLIDKQHLSYDFYLPDYNVLIEYQGGQHYYPVEWLGGNKRFKKQLRHDAMKYQYAKNNGYLLIYVPYICNTYDKVSRILEEWGII